MKPATLLGVIHALNQQFLTPLLIIALIALAFYKTGQDSHITPCVINTLGKGKIQYMNCDPTDLRANKEVLVDSADRLLEVLYNYRKGGIRAYASQFEQFKHFIANYSPAAQAIRRHVEGVIGDRKGPIMEETSSIELVYDSLESTVGEDGRVYITADAVRLLERAQGVLAPIKIRIDMTFEIGESRNEIYHIYDYSIRTL